MNEPNASSQFSLVVVGDVGRAMSVYSLAEAARLVDLHPDRVRYYCRLGLFGPALESAETELVFDDDRLYELRRFEHFRQHHGVNQKTLRLLCALWREVEHLRTELRFLRDR